MKSLRKAIKSALSKVSKKNAPMIYDAIQTENGYKNMEDRMVHIMIDNDLTASESVPHLESTL